MNASDTHILPDTALQTIERLKNKSLSSDDVIAALAARRARIGESLNVFAHVVDAPRDARPGPLAGLAMTIKDQIHVRDMPCGFGLQASNAPWIPSRSAGVVQAFENAGARIIGKTSLPPLAMDFQTSNHAIGSSNNPWNLAYTTGGSSGGSAAALAAGLTFLDIGADLAGSLRIPASFCGVLSLMPSAGALPTDGLMTPDAPPLSHFATSGPMAASIDDLDLAWRIISGQENIFEQHAPMRAPKIGVWRGDSTLPIDPEMLSMIDLALTRFRDAGCTLTDTNADGIIGADSWQTYGNIMGYETSAGMSYGLRLLARFGGRKQAKASARFLAPVHDGYRRNVARYERAKLRLNQISATFAHTMEAFDCLLLPVTCTRAFKHLAPTTVRGPLRSYDTPLPIGQTTMSYLDAMTAFTTPISVTGHPVITIPIGIDSNGLPVGVQLVGKRNQENQLLATARTLLDALPFDTRAPISAA